MEDLPADAAQELRDFAWDASWACANETKWFHDDDAARHRALAERHFQVCHCIAPAVCTVSGFNHRVHAYELRRRL
jgi:hypothetical protein